MAKKLKVGDSIRGYRITKVFGPGMMAISYGAVGPDGRKVFFKQYKSPAPTVVWYEAFVEYQRELSRRVREGRVGHFAVRQLDAFEERWGGPCYFQAYEFVENGADLQKILDDERERHRATGTAPTRDADVWARHVTWAKVLVAALAALHEAKVVHADLKPANAYLIADPTLGSGYQLKLIDMDFSLLADRRAPWHGFQGYVGTDNYRSPEHLTRRAVPGPASDVFTCGLMLYELLAGEHPYWRAEQDDYARLAQSHAARPPAIAGPLPAPVDAAEVAAMLHRCLSPDPEARPSAAQLRAALSGRGDRPATTATPAPASAVAGRAPAAPAGAPRAPERGAPRAAAPRPGAQPLTSPGIELTAPGGASLRIGVRTELGKALLRRLGEDSAFWDERQCVIERRAGQPWVVTPIAGTTNETLVNGVAIDAPRVLQADDSLAVGRQAKGIVKLPLTVRAAG
ncbi:MAG TPA: protein kinase [Burkholderiaceae bacterium]|nr:protein kinase [Burkholderiaceae bacterium]